MQWRGLGFNSVLFALGLSLSPALFAFPSCGSIEPVARGGTEPMRGVMHPPKAGQVTVRFSVGRDGLVSELQLIEQRWEGRTGEADEVLEELLNRIGDGRYAPRADPCTRILVLNFELR